ncbi:MAG: hypothetical protein JWN13_202 [Betaproteobacteria bacterium]|jgi:uncharacterized membrane protein|nr:hypothetical protein [Betaproteobacteria bacterium]
MHSPINAHWIVHLRAGHRLVFSFTAAMVALLLQPHDWGYRLHFLITWNVAALTYLGLAWTVIARCDATMTRRQVRSQDASTHAIFLLVVIAAFASTAAIGILLGNVKDLPFWPRFIHVTLSVVALMLSWLLIHTLYSFHYAHRFYAQQGDSNAEPRGLNFPGSSDPDYLDFAYYSFVVGMTSQVSDVAVTARHMRRLTLIHGILSFFFNIAILALGINIIASVI